MEETNQGKASKGRAWVLVLYSWVSRPLYSYSRLRVWVWKSNWNKTQVSDWVAFPIDSRVLCVSASKLAWWTFTNRRLISAISWLNSVSCCRAISICFRSVISSAIPQTRLKLGFCVCTINVRSKIQRIEPSGRTMRYSTSVFCPCSWSW